MLTSEYMEDLIYELLRKIWRHDWSAQLCTQLRQPLWNSAKAEKNSGLNEPMASAIQVQCSPNWVIKPTGSWLLSEIVIFPWMAKMCCFLKVVYNCDNQSCLHIFLRSSNTWSFIYSLAFFTINGILRTAEVSKFNARKKSHQTKWRTSREKFCCKQIYYSFSKPILKFSWYISLRIQRVAFSIASNNDHTQFLCCGRLSRRRIKLSFPTIFSHQLAWLFLSLKSLQY